MPELNSELKPFPCPACGDGDVAKAHSALEFWVFCVKCLITGPVGFSESAAIIAWNSLPRALAWTTEPPTVAGFYWWRCKKEQPDIPLMVMVDIDSARKFSSFFIYGGEPSFHCCDKCQWARVTPPRE